MTTARDVMSLDTEYASTTDTVGHAARLMRDRGVGALPICGEDNRLAGMITDRDIAMKCVADGRDPDSMTVEAYVSDEAVTVGADDSIEVVLRTMTGAGVRRLPVVDGHELVGMVSQADLARSLDADGAGRLVAAISSGVVVD